MTTQEFDEIKQVGGRVTYEYEVFFIGAILRKERLLGICNGVDAFYEELTWVRYENAELAK